MIENKQEIAHELERSFQNTIEFINKMDKPEFENRPDGKWSAGQHINHLIKSAGLLNLALLIPKFIYPLIWGKMNRKARSYDELLNRYNEKLNKGAKPARLFIPDAITFNQREKDVMQFKKESEKLIAHLNRLSDVQLDSLIIPHPLLGKLSIREMMFFTILHTKHHLNILKNRT